MEQRHNLGREEAIRRINAFIEEMMVKELPAGVKVTEFTKNWADNVLTFSLTAKKSFFLSATITGAVRVTDDLVAMDVELPGILTAFMSEEKIKADGETQLAKVLR